MEVGWCVGSSVDVDDNVIYRFDGLDTDMVPLDGGETYIRKDLVSDILRCVFEAFIKEDGR